MVEAVKFVEGSDQTVIEGLAFPYDGPMRGKDFQGERFTPDTDLALDWFPQGRPLIYDHGIDGAHKLSLQGRQTEDWATDEGRWARAQLDRSAKYHATVERLIRAGKLFFSSGSMPHLAQTDRKGNITQWPWIELTLTTTPANPYAGVYPVKSLLADLSTLGLAVPPELIAEALKRLEPTEDIEGNGASRPFVDDADQLLADVASFRDRAVSLVDRRVKSGRVLSAATRERLSRHPGSLRELADDLDSLLSDSDAEKAEKAILVDLSMQTETILSRALGVDI